MRCCSWVSTVRGSATRSAGGLDLAEVGPARADGTLRYPEDARDPWRNDGRPCNFTGHSCARWSVNSPGVKQARRLTDSRHEISHARAASYSSRRRHHGPVSLRPFGARSSHWYIPHSPSSPRAYAE